MDMRRKSNCNVSILSINVRGLRDSVRRARITEWVKLLNVDIVLMQETYLRENDFDGFKNSWKGKVFFSPSYSVHSCGVLIAFSDKLNCTYSQIRHDDIGRCISVLCTFSSFSLRICNIYAPNSGSERRCFFSII